jgi:hypothetical protein
VKFTVQCAHYENNCLSSQNVYKFHELFGNSFTGLMDKHPPRRTVKAATLDTVQHANEFSQEKCVLN